MIEITKIKIDDEALKSNISEAMDLNNNDEMFTRLLEVSKAKKEVADALEKIEAIEKMAKSEIDSRAKNLYGKDWQAIAGEGYKISRSFTGSVYTFDPENKPAKKYLVIKETVNTKLVDAEAELKDGVLPKGIEINPSRGSSIRINLKG